MANNNPNKSSSGTSAKTSSSPAKSTSSSKTSSSPAKTNSSAPKPSTGAEKLVASFGPKISQKEIQTYQNKGYDIGTLEKAAAAQKATLKSPAKKAVEAAKTAQAQRRQEFQAKIDANNATYATSNTPGASGATGASNDAVSQDKGDTTSKFEPTITPGEGQLYASEYANIIKDLDGQIEFNKTKLLADAQVTSAGLAAKANEFESRQATERLLGATRIESQGKLDLQKIINAGLANVTALENEAKRDVATITGQYGVKQVEAQQTGQKDIARISSRSNILQGLVGAFNF